MNGDADPREMQPRAREAAVRAVRGEPTLGEAHAALAAIDFMLDWDWPAAEAGYRTATVLAPGFALGHVMLAHVLSQMGRHGEAGVPMRPSLELEPLSGLLLAMSSQVAFQERYVPPFAVALVHADLGQDADRIIAPRLLRGVNLRVSATPRTPLHRHSLAASPAQSVPVARFATLARVLLREPWIAGLDFSGVPSPLGLPDGLTRPSAHDAQLNGLS